MPILSNLLRTRRPPEDADRAWLRRIAHQDRVALAALYRAYQPRLARFLSRMTRQEDLIEEVINDTFYVVWQKAGQYRGDARASTWIMGIAYRQALKALRDGVDPCLHNAEEELEALLVVDPDSQRETHDWLDKALRKLPDELRLTVELVYGQGHTVEEVAAIMDCPVGTTKSRLFHARVRLRNLLPGLAVTASATAAQGGNDA
jgi:RNA polymerase sigma-70 factor (ECF subfamily)